MNIGVFQKTFRYLLSLSYLLSSFVPLILLRILDVICATLFWAILRQNLGHGKNEFLRYFVDRFQNLPIFLENPKFLTSSKYPVTFFEKSVRPSIRWHPTPTIQTMSHQGSLEGWLEDRPTFGQMVGPRAALVNASV